MQLEICSQVESLSYQKCLSQEPDKCRCSNLIWYPEWRPLKQLSLRLLSNGKHKESCLKSLVLNWTLNIFLLAKNLFQCNFRNWNLTHKNKCGINLCQVFGFSFLRIFNFEARSCTSNLVSMFEQATAAFWIMWHV